MKDKLMSYRKNICLLLLALGAASFWSGCAWVGTGQSPSRFYVLDTADYTPVSQEVEEGIVLAVNRVEVARYLESPGLTIRENDHRIYHSQLHRWAESIGHGVTRVLAENLRREPVVAHVMLESSQWGQLADYHLQVAVLRAEGVVPKGEESARAVFHVSWELRAGPEGEVAASGRVFEDNLPWNGENFDQLAANLSLGVGDLSQQIARALDELR